MLSNPIKTKDTQHFVQRGTSPFNVWYSSQVANSGFGSGAQGVNLLRGMPFMSGEGGAIDKISIEIVTGGAAGAVSRCGIYQATSDTNIYPSKLIVDSGEFDTTTSGIKTATIAVNLLPNTLYWFVHLNGVNACTMRLANNNGCPQALGFPATFGTNSRSGLSVAQAYGALPATFTAGGTFPTGGVCLVWVHFA